MLYGYVYIYIDISYVCDILDDLVIPNKPEPGLCLFKAPNDIIQWVLEAFKDRAGWMGQGQWQETNCKFQIMIIIYRDCMLCTICKDYFFQLITIQLLKQLDTSELFFCGRCEH